MKTWILNFLMTRIGAAVAPVILGAIASLVAWLAADVPWLAPHVTTENCLAAVGIGLAVAMSFVNYLTTARGFKYAGPVQRLIAVLAEKLDLPPVRLDSVLASKSASTAVQIETILTRPGGAFNPDAPVRRAVLGRQNDMRSRKGFVLFHVLVGGTLVAVTVLIGCAAWKEQQKNVQGAPGAGEAHNLSRVGSTPAPATLPRSHERGYAFPDVTETTNLVSWTSAARSPQVLYCSTLTAEYNRPAWQRLLSSLRPWTETGSARAKVRVDEDAATLSGTWMQGEKWDPHKVMPTSYALGVGGELEF